MFFVSLSSGYSCSCFETLVMMVVVVMVVVVVLLLWLEDEEGKELALVLESLLTSSFTCSVLPLSSHLFEERGT